MPDPRKEALAPYLRALADLMGLRDWTVGINHEPPDPRHLAECDARFGRKIAWIHLSEAFLNAPPDRQRQTLGHELLHAHTAHLEHLMHGELTEPGYRAFTLALEYAIDGIAEEWAKSLPLPDQVAPAPGLNQ